jgi:cyclophilin family peptidyl-prolyl cis-trans isomerase/protein-disulfide isomerase
LLLLSACSPQPTAAPVPSLEPTQAPSAPAPEVGCTAITAEPTPVNNAPVPPVTEADYSIGPADASVTLIEYCDFQAPICHSMAAAVSNVVHNHPNDVRFVFRPVPLIGQLDKSQLAVQAALAADRQGKFWEMYDVLFQQHTEWEGLSSEDFQAWLGGQAVQLGLDGEAFAAALNDPAVADQTRSMFEAGRSLAIPFVIINGKPQPSFAINYSSLESTISLIALGARQFTSCPPFTIDPARQYIATVHTEKGDIVIQLFPDKAPLAVNSFVFLARQGWFDGVTFHRVITGFAAQAGDPSGTGRGGPGYFFKNELDPNLKYDKPGVVGMANSGPDTNGSQFFITFGPAPHLDGGFTIFGQVLSGMEVVESLTPRDPLQGGLLPPGDKILSVTIEER